MKNQMILELIPVRKAARKVALSRDQLHTQIRKARDGGQPLRSIADAAGMSYETVRRICDEGR